VANIKEKKEKLAEQIAKLQARYKQLDQKDKVQERKARTKRLIEVGAVIESKFSADAISVLKDMPKERLVNVEKWLLEHKNMQHFENNMEKSV